jgi:DNA-directed RNA polymerase subunit RPC12/RpoP
MGFENEARNALGRYYEESGNYAKAAEMYEKSGNKEKAMELRNRDREVHIYQKNVNIEVNMDSLLEYLRIHGEVVKYTCPNCGAQLEIDGKNSMYFCPYCGTKVDVLSLKELIDKIL